MFNALNQVAGTFPQLGPLSGAAGAVQVSSPLTSSLGQFLDTEAAVDTVLVLLFVSLIVAGAAVIAVAAWMVTVRRAAELTLLQARGASVAQLSAHLLRGAAAVALPAALLGAGWLRHRGRRGLLGARVVAGRAGHRGWPGRARW